MLRMLYRVPAMSSACRDSCVRLLKHNTNGIHRSTTFSTALTAARRLQSDVRGESPIGPGITRTDAAAKPVTYEEVWSLWNEGNLFSLSLVQMQEFLKSAGVPVDAGAKKAAVVRRVEEYLNAKDGAGGGTGVPKDGGRGGSSNDDRYGRWSASPVQPETLLDLAQSGFYEGAANMAPKAFQLLVDGSSADVVVSRVNTTAFPGFPANTECYTLVASEADTSTRSRFSKVLQWCFLNMSNLQMNGELTVSVGKMLLAPRVMQHNESVVSPYVLQQRLQLHHPYTWVNAVPESAVPAAEAFWDAEGFAPVGKTATVTYDGIIKRAKDQVLVELDSKGTLTALRNDWVNMQTVYHTHRTGADVRLLLRSRPPLRQVELDTYSGFPIIELANDDVTDVLPSEHGQLIYLSECETRRFERVSDRGIVLSVTEVKRQPLIVLHDEEEDPRVEYNITVLIPASASGRPMDVRAVGLEVFELANRFAAAVKESFVADFGCVPMEGNISTGDTKSGAV